MSHPKNLLLVCALTALSLIAMTGCSSTPEEEVSPTPTSPTPTPEPEVTIPLGCDVAVYPSADDQTAVQTALIQASSGSVVCLVDGPFSFLGELSVDVPGLTLRGINQPELDFIGQITGANGISILSDDFVIEDLLVLNPAGDGVRATAVNNVTYRGVEVKWETVETTNGAYGLYPVQSDGVLIEDCIVSGASDAGIYVGQSTGIKVLDSEVYNNVAGIEIENSTGAEVAGNYAHDNTGGILVFNLPGLPVKDGKYSYVHSNIITSNNQKNFAPEGNIVALVPQGTGIMVLASDFNEFANNTIEDNVSLGLLILSYDETLIGPIEDPEFDKYPEGNYVHDNTFSNNGTAPKDVARTIMLAKGVASPVPAMIWDGCTDSAKDNSSGALTNCFYQNGTGGTYGNIELCQGMEVPATFDLEAVTCQHDSLAD